MTQKYNLFPVFSYSRELLRILSVSIVYQGDTNLFYSRRRNLSVLTRMNPLNRQNPLFCSDCLNLNCSIQHSQSIIYSSPRNQEYWSILGTVSSGTFHSYLIFVIQSFQRWIYLIFIRFFLKIILLFSCLFVYLFIYLILKKNEYYFF